MNRKFKIACLYGNDATKYESFDRFTDGIRLIKDMGYEAIELSLLKPLGYEPRQMNRFLESINMPIANFLTGDNAVKDNIWFSSPNAEVRAKAVKRICDLIPMAAEMNASMVVGTMQGRGLESDYNVGKARIIECLKKIAEVTEKYKTLIVIEPMNFLECGYHHTLRETMETIRLIGSNYYKPMLDTIHMHIEESNMINPFHEAGAELMHVHLCETNFAGAGTGRLDYKGIFEALNIIGYSRYVTLKDVRDPWPEGDKNSLLFLKNINLF